MKILVVSDSHGQISDMERAVELEDPRIVIHLGDRVEDAEDLERRCPNPVFISLPGNCDYFCPDRPDRLLRKLGGISIFMTHGHRYGVKSDLLRLTLAAREAGAEIALFGHTHCALCEKQDGLWLMNPGACGGSRPSCGIIDTSRPDELCRVVRFRDLEESTCF